MNQAFAGKDYDTLTSPSASELGVNLFSSGRLIEETINGRPSDGNWFFLLIAQGTCIYTHDNMQDGYDRGLLVVPPVQNGCSVRLLNSFQGILFCIPKDLVPYGWNKTSYSSLNVMGVEQLMNYYHLMRDVSESADHPESWQEMSCLCRAFVTSCGQHFMIRTQYQGPRPTEISKEFLNLVVRHCSRERGLRFYANHLGVTPKYLSAVVSSTTNKTAGKWIGEYTIAHAKKLLKTTGKSIMEVATDMRFRSSSDFCHYFKTYAGRTPNKFRDDNKQSVFQAILKDCTK